MVSSLVVPDDDIDVDDVDDVDDDCSDVLVPPDSDVAVVFVATVAADVDKSTVAELTSVALASGLRLE